MKIDPSKKYKTRSGRPVEFLHRAPEGWPNSFPWRGIVAGEPISWMDNGSQFNDATERANDLIEVCELMRLNVWVKDGHGPIFCVSDTELTTWKMNELGYTLKEFVEVMP
jgi:hypothetical protein